MSYQAPPTKRHGNPVIMIDAGGLERGNNNPPHTSYLPCIFAHASCTGGRSHPHVDTDASFPPTTSLQLPHPNSFVSYLTPHTSDVPRSAGETPSTAAKPARTELFSLPFAVPCSAAQCRRSTNLPPSHPPSPAPNPPAPPVPTQLRGVIGGVMNCDTGPFRVWVCLLDLLNGHHLPHPALPRPFSPTLPSCKTQDGGGSHAEELDGTTGQGREKGRNEKEQVQYHLSLHARGAPHVSFSLPRLR